MSDPRDYIPLSFLKLRFEYHIVFTFRSIEVRFYKNFRGLNKIWEWYVEKRFYTDLDFWDVFEASSNKILLLYVRRRLLYTGISRCWDFQSIACKEIAQKLYKNDIQVKNLKIQSSSLNLGNYEVITYHKTAGFPLKTCCEPNCIIESYSKLSSYQICLMKNHWKCQNWQQF